MSELKEKFSFNDLSTGLIIFYSIMFLLCVTGIIIFLIVGFIFQNNLKKAESNQSQYCYIITCPCSNSDEKPCGAYAKRKVGDNWSCSNAPNIIVNDNGEPVN